MLCFALLSSCFSALDYATCTAGCLAPRSVLLLFVAIVTAIYIIVPGMMMQQPVFLSCVGVLVAVVVL